MASFLTPGRFGIPTSPFQAPAAEFYQEMAGPSSGNLVAGMLSDQAVADSPLYGNPWGNMMYGSGTEAPMAARGARLASAGAQGSNAGMQRRLGGANDWLSLSNAFAKGQAGLKGAQQAGSQAKDAGIAGLIGNILGPLIGGDPSNLFSQLIAGGQPLTQSLGLPSMQNMAGTLGGLNPGGTGMMGMFSNMLGPGAASGPGALAAGANTAAAASPGVVPAGADAIMMLLQSGMFA